MTITEAVAWQHVADFLRGDVDHCDEGTRQKIAHDLAVLDQRAHAALKAGQPLDVDEWDAALCLVTLEAP